MTKSKILSEKMAQISWINVLEAITKGRPLTRAQMRAAIEDMMEGRCGEVEAAAFLMGLRMKGETAQEIAWAAEVLREHMVRWDPGCDVLDTCGTGGDGSGTLNISTAVAFVVAGAGVKVVKHGNRSVSSKSGSADVLAHLGIKIEGGADKAQMQLETAGLAFCFAPVYHPALSNVAAVRRRLGVPTIFNCVGPLVNPAGAQRQVMGVGRTELLDCMAGALAILGTTRSLVVCGRDGLDEVSLAGPTLVREVTGGQVRADEWPASVFGLEKVSKHELAAADARESAKLIESVLQGQTGPTQRIVSANAGAAFFVADRVKSLREGVVLAEQTINSGEARKVLEKLRNLDT